MKHTNRYNASLISVIYLNDIEYKKNLKIPKV
jgi:hypothetical protein